MNSDVVRIGSCILACDMACMVRFYRDTLDFKPIGMAVILLSLRRRAVRYPFGYIAEKNL